jgi:hypothetical protein
MAIAVVTADLERPSILTGGLKRLARARVNEALTGAFLRETSIDPVQPMRRAVAQPLIEIPIRKATL